MAAEDAGEPLDDGEVEFEDDIDEEVCVEPVPPIDLYNNLPSASRNDRKYAKLTKCSRAKQAAEAVERIMSRGVKPFVVELAKGALPLELEDFDASALPVSSSGWNANSRKKLSPGLQRVWKNLDTLSTLSGLKLLRWDGQSCIVLIDAHDRIIAVLGGVPHGSQGKEWQAVEAEATAAVMCCRESSTFTESQKHGRRGDFASRTVGYGYGNGWRKPKNYKVSGRANQNAIQELLQNQVIWRISGFQNALFNTFCHKNYAEYRDTNDEIQLKQPELWPNFRNTVFAATTFNLGPLSFSPPHMDPDNRASSWCANTNMGPFDPDKGGHLVL
ncbi:hypothetical protein EV359DRAFT_86763 [Lentinula novae-zelandiae]|nr:hypothetical protein EV359DRAFT_86763 [Lentinula novae-zelandiae]